MKQRIERVYFEESEMKYLVRKVNEYTATVSVGNVMDVSIETRMRMTYIRKYQTDHTDRKGSSFRSETEEYVYDYFAIVTVLVEE